MMWTLLSELFSMSNMGLRLGGCEGTGNCPDCCISALLTITAQPSVHQRHTPYLSAQLEFNSSDVRSHRGSASQQRISAGLPTTLMLLGVAPLVRQLCTLCDGRGYSLGVAL
jgi:hypothetical protein